MMMMTVVDDDDSSSIRATGLSRAIFGVIESSAGITKPHLWFCSFYHLQNHTPPPSLFLWAGGGPPTPPPLLNLQCEIIWLIQYKTMMR